MTPKDKKIIEDAELNGTPIFVFTAKDQLAIDALLSYKNICVNNFCDLHHIEGIAERIDEFHKWRMANPTIVKLPD